MLTSNPVKYAWRVVVGFSKMAQKKHQKYLLQTRGAEMVHPLLVSSHRSLIVCRFWCIPHVPGKLFWGGTLPKTASQEHGMYQNRRQKQVVVQVKKRMHHFSPTGPQEVLLRHVLAIQGCIFARIHNEG